MIKYQEGNFFDVYPELAYKLPFRMIKESFSKGKASKIAWYIILYCGENSEFRTYPPEIRREQLEQHFIKEEVHELPEVQEAIEMYEEHMMSLARRNFFKWEEKLTERQKFIEDTPYDETTYEMLDKLMSQTEKMWKMFLTLKAEMDKDSDEGKTYGGIELSDAEKGMI